MTRTLQTMQRPSRQPRLIVAYMIGVITGIGLTSMKAVQVLWRWGKPEFKQQVAQFNKRWTNPVAKSLLFAGHLHSPYALIHHVGRRSGCAYTTPVILAPISGGFLIPIAYGEWADWVRNLQAARGAVINWQGTSYQVGPPTVIESPSIPSQFPRLWRNSLQRNHISHYLQVLIVPTAQEIDEQPAIQKEPQHALHHE